jgi:hypothetical protein
MLRPGPQPPPRVALSQRTRRWLWIVAILDMTAVAWLLAGVGTWLDRASRLTAVFTLGGHHLVVLIMAIAGFLLLAGAAVLTEMFTSASKLDLTLITVACIVSVIALAGALSVILLVMGGAVLLGLLLRLFL